MDARVLTKDIPCGDKIYQVRKMDARTACWLFSNLAVKADGSSILSALGKCSRPEYDEIQNLSLKHIFRLDEKDGSTFPMAVISPDGLNWVDKNLSEDPALVFKLTAEVIQFNLDPFRDVSE